MAYPPITTLPAAPSRQDPTNFADEADAFLGALPDFGDEANALASYVEGVAGDVDTDATAAAASATAAATSASSAAAAQTAAEAAANATLWVSGTTYSAGDVVYSPSTYFTYRATSGLTSTVDPATDTANWTLIGVGGTALLSITNTTATQDQTAFTGSYTAGAVVVTLNGVILTDTTDYTATDGTTVTLSTGADAGDEVSIIGFPTFVVADTLPLSGGTLTGALAGTTATFSGAVTAASGDVSGEFIADSYNETYSALTAGATVDIDCETANAFSLTLDQITTITFSNPPASGTSYSFTLKIVQDASASGYTVTWPSAVDWPAATAPTLTATASAVDYFVFITHDGGTNWYGFTAGQALG